MNFSRIWKIFQKPNIFFRSLKEEKEVCINYLLRLSKIFIRQIYYIAIGGNEPVIVVAFIFLGLSIKFLFWSTIGNAIYYNAQKKKKPKAKSPAIGIADEIRKFKDLLDDGVITQEEFDKKKKDLLR